MRLAHSFNFTCRYIDGVLSLNNPKFSEYSHHIYPDELEIKDTTDSYIGYLPRLSKLILKAVYVLDCMINVMISTLPC